jgi:hypothetical protein
MIRGSFSTGKEARDPEFWVVGFYYVADELMFSYLGLVSSYWRLLLLIAVWEKVEEEVEMGLNFP